jgi:magnesium chelatase family protein
LEAKTRLAIKNRTLVYSAYQEGFDRVYVPAEDAAEAGLIQGIEIIPVRTLGELVEDLYGLQPISPYVALPVSTNGETATPDWLVYFADIKGFEHTKQQPI